MVKIFYPARIQYVHTDLETRIYKCTDIHQRKFDRVKRSAITPINNSCTLTPNLDSLDLLW